MSNDATPVSSWATGTNQTWSTLKKGFKHLSVEYAALGDKASEEVCELFPGVFFTMVNNFYSCSVIGAIICPWERG